VGPGCRWRAQARGDGPREGEGCAQERERERERGGEVWAGSGPTEGGFPFLFSISYFSLLFSISLSHFLLNK
jgi:hypothetical protein